MQKKQQQDTRQEQAGRLEIPAELVAEAKAGDQAAFTELFDLTHKAIYRTIRSMVRDEDLVWDIHQDTYLRAFKSLDKLEKDESFFPWLRRIAVNVTAKTMAKRNPLPFSELGGAEEGGEPEPPDPSPAGQPELALDRKENARMVREILSGLPEAQQMVVGMRYYEELPVEEIAALLGVTQGTVKTQLHRGRKRIETAVRELERRGVKLYGLSPLPFLMALLRRLEPAEAAEKQAAAALAKSGVKTVGVRVGRRFVETAAGRVVLGLLAAGVVGGGVAGYRWLQRRAEPRGDVKPPVLIMDSPEALQTEPVTTAPETTAPETTEPVTTEPEITEPETTEELTEPPEVPDTGEEAPPEPEPTQPAAPAPTQPQPTEQPIPTEPGPGGILVWNWDTGGDMDWTPEKQNGEYSPRILCVTVSGDQTPWVYTDNESVLQIVQRKPTEEDLQNLAAEGKMEYRWTVKPIGCGTAKIYCDYNGKNVKSLTVTVPEQSLEVFFLETRPYLEFTEYTLANTVTGRGYTVIAEVSGSMEAQFSTDNSAVLQLSETTTEKSSDNRMTRYTADINIIGAGNAHLYVSMDGTVRKTWNIHASNAQMDTGDSTEDLIPIDAESQVMSWWVNGGTLPLLLHLGNSGKLYVKMKGPEQPVLTVDDPSVISLSPKSSNIHEDRNVYEYWYILTPQHSGTCTVTCTFRGSEAFTVPIVVP